MLFSNIIVLSIDFLSLILQKNKTPMKRLFVMFAVVFLSLGLKSQQRIEFIEYDLPNGIHVILHQEKATPIVAVAVLYHVGSKNETPDRTGFAHFFEHLLFEGSRNIERGEYTKYVEGNGGGLNANTSFDRTYYYELLPSNQLELGLWLESERMLHAKVDSVGIETQRSVVKEEKRQTEDNRPYGSLFTELLKRIFPEPHPYNWSVIGSMEHLDAAQEEDYVNFYQRFYVPSNATLSIAGDIDIEQTKQWINKYFGSIPKGQAINLYRDYLRLSDAEFANKYAIEKSLFDEKDFFSSTNSKAKAKIAEYEKIPAVVVQPIAPDNKQNSVIKDIVYDNIQLPALVLGYRFPAQTHPDSYALEMMFSVLSDGESSRTNKELVERKELAVQAFSFAIGLESGGVGCIAAIVAKDADLDEVLEVLDTEIEKIQTELISQEEYEKVRNQYENRIISSYSSVGRICESLAQAHVYFGAANYINVEFPKYYNVTREDILRVAKEYLTKDARVILQYLPKED